MARHDPHGKEDLGERFSQFASVCGITDGHDLRSANDTPALNALKALRGAPISMGRGEIPVELRPAAIRFCHFSYIHFCINYSAMLRCRLKHDAVVIERNVKWNESRSTILPQ